MTKAEQAVETADTEKTEKKSKFVAPELGSPRVPYKRLFVDDTTNARGFGEGIDTESESIKNLAANIQEIGLQEPIAVRIIQGSKLTADQRAIIGLDEDDKPAEWYAKVVAGARRYYAIGQIIAETKGAFKEGVPVIVQEGEISTVDEFFAMFSENVEREQLSPAEMAAAIYKARKVHGLSTADIRAKMPSLTKEYLSHLYKLKSGLSEKVWAAFAAEEISFDTARLLLSAGEHDAQDKALAKVLKHIDDTGQKGKKKKKGVKEVARKAAKGDKDSAPAAARPKQADIKEKLAELEESAGNNYQKGQRDALRWAVGAKGYKRLPTELKG